MFAHTRLVVLAMSLFVSACASLPAREAASDTEFVTISVRNDSPEHVQAFLVWNRTDGEMLGIVRSQESSTFRIPRGKLEGVDIELHAYSRDTRMMTNDAVEASKLGRPPRPLNGGTAYVSRPFRTAPSADIQWKLDRMNYMSSLYIR